MNTHSIRMLVAKTTPYWVRRWIPLKISRHFYFTGVFEARLYGRKIVKLMHHGHQIENEIYWRGFDGSLEKKSMQIFAAIVKNLNPSIVWDIGANSGTYGILAKALKPDCQVIFFEPIPRAVECIHFNLKLNNYKAKVFEVALGNYDGQGHIFFPKGQDFGVSVTLNRNTVPIDAESDEMSVQVCRAGTLITQQGLKFPDLVKLDVETYEFEVLEGWGDQFPKDSIFLIEILQEELALKLAPFFPIDMYTFWNIDDRNGNVRKVPKLMKSDFYNFLIVPNSKNSHIGNILVCAS